MGIGRGLDCSRGREPPPAMRVWQDGSDWSCLASNCFSRIQSISKSAASSQGSRNTETEVGRSYLRNRKDLCSLASQRSLWIVFSKHLFHPGMVKQACNPRPQSLRQKFMSLKTAWDIPSPSRFLSHFLPPSPPLLVPECSFLLYLGENFLKSTLLVETPVVARVTLGCRDSRSVPSTGENIWMFYFLFLYPFVLFSYNVHSYPIQLFQIDFFAIKNNSGCLW